MPNALDSVTRSSEVRQKYKIMLPFAQASVTFVKGSFTSDVGRSKFIRILLAWIFVNTVQLYM